MQLQFIDKFLHCFFPIFSVKRVTENDKEFFCEISTEKFSLSDDDTIAKYYNFLQSHDELTFIISFGNANPISFLSSKLDFKNFKQELESEYIHQENEPIKAELVINKTIYNNTISIYDLDAFTNSLEFLKIEQAFTIFDRVLSKSHFIIFKVFNLEESFETRNIFFIPFNAPVPPNTYIDRQKHLDNVVTTSNYANFKSHRLTPDDFKILIENIKYKNLCLLFERFAIVLAVIYLFDITSLEGNELEFKINGYKSNKGIIDITKLKINETKEYFDIYFWVFNGGNLNDKIGLARNIISLHLFMNGKLELRDNPFQSILSSYKIYEKQNIQQYIEIRNKISEQLLDFNNRANSIIETFAGGFQRSALALISFYISAIVINVLGKGEFLNIFTIDTTILSSTFIICSFIYFLISRWEVKEQRKRFNSSYNNLKERYTDLLEKNDIQKILNNDKDFNDNLEFINNKLLMYTIIWITFLSLLFLATIALFFIYNLSLSFVSILLRLLFSIGCFY